MTSRMWPSPQGFAKAVGAFAALIGAYCWSSEQVSAQCQMTKLFAPDGAAGDTFGREVGFDGQ